MVDRGRFLVRGKENKNSLRDNFICVGMGKDNAKYMQNK